MNSLALFFFPVLISITIIGHPEEKTRHCPVPAIFRIMSLVGGFCVYRRDDERQGKQFGFFVRTTHLTVI